MNLPSWKTKIKRYSIKGRNFWYLSDDGGLSWRRISTKDAIQMIDDIGGVIIK